MISREQIQELIDRPTSGNPVMSVFLDMSVNSNNKRTHHIFLNKERSKFQELDSDRENHHREEVGRAFARLDDWIDENYDEANKGVAVHIEVGGDWMRAAQVPIPLPNRLTIGDRPIVGPLVEIIESYHHHGVILVDREHLRLLSLYLDQTLHEREVETEPYPTPHDVKRGGFSARDFQQRKEQEARHFFKEFAAEIEDFDRTHRPDDLTILGTPENVNRLTEFLADHIRDKVSHTDRAAIDATAAQVREQLAPVFRRRLEEEQAHAVDRLRDRVREEHLAVAGLDQTLQRLQEGKVETLVIARDLERDGGRCDQCGFLHADITGTCSYCGGQLRDGVDLVEEMVRMAEDQKAQIDFVTRQTIEDLGGVGGLLRF